MMLLFLNMSGGEILVIVLVAYLVLGPKRIPEIARAIGKGMNELRRATDDIRSEITREVNNIKKDVNVDFKETIIPDAYSRPAPPPADPPAPAEQKTEAKQPGDDLR